MSGISIIGAGHNGLVCACYLARAGHRVTVYEQAPIPGGCTTTEEKYPGFRYNIGAIEVEGLVHSGVIDDLELERHGLELIRKDHLLSAWIGEEAFHFVRDREATLKGLRMVYGAKAADEWRAFTRYGEAVMKAIGTLQRVKAPDLGGISAIMGRIGEIGEANERVLRSFIAPCLSVLDEWLSCPMTRAASLAYATHPQLPPWLPGTGPLACLLPSSHGGLGARPKGGTGRIIDALMACLEAHGGEVRCSCGVKRIDVSNGRVTGLGLSTGESVSAGTVVSTIDIKRVAAMMDPQALPEPMERAARSAHCGIYNVGEIKLDLALKEAPRFLNDQAGCEGALKYLMAEPDSYVRNFQDILGGRLPEKPPMMVGLPTIDDPSLAPAGRAVLWISSFVPAKFHDGRTWPEVNQEVADHLLETFEQFAPGTRSLILHCEITGPWEWEQRTGNPAGNPNHIDMTVDQCFSFRPGPGIDRYQTPVKGLYLSGAGTHPGGGVHGMPGRLAAETILDGGKRTSRRGPSLLGLARSYFDIRKALS